MTPTVAGQERQPALAVSREQALGGERGPQLLQPRQELTQADRSDLQRRQRERAAA